MAEGGKACFEGFVPSANDINFRTASGDWAPNRGKEEEEEEDEEEVAFDGC